MKSTWSWGSDSNMPRGLSIGIGGIAGMLSTGAQEEWSILMECSPGLVWYICCDAYPIGGDISECKCSIPLALGLKSDIVVAGVVLWLLAVWVRAADCDAVLLTATGLESKGMGGRSARRRSNSASYWIPCATRISLRISFSSRTAWTAPFCWWIVALASAISVVYASRSRDTSVSNARMYCSLRSRCVLCESAQSSFLDKSCAYLWACRFSSCRLVSAGLLSGLGPRRLGC
jgi:hypothetical protein